MTSALIQRSSAAKIGTSPRRCRHRYPTWRDNNGVEGLYPFQTRVHPPTTQTEETKERLEGFFSRINVRSSPCDATRLVSARFNLAYQPVYRVTLQSQTYSNNYSTEVDCITEGSWGEWAIEVKTGGFDSKDLRGLLEFCRRYPRKRPLVITAPGNESQARSLGVTSISWSDFLLSGPPI